MHYSAYIEVYRSNVIFKYDILRSTERRLDQGWSKRWKKMQRNATKFLGSILHHANSVSML